MPKPAFEQYGFSCENPSLSAKLAAQQGSQALHNTNHGSPSSTCSQTLSPLSHYLHSR